MPPRSCVAEAPKAELNVVGKPLPKVDAAAKVTGQTLFADDLVLPRMAFARLLRSPHPHARVKRVDVTRAAAHPGVVATLVGAELPIPFGILPVSQDEHALALDKVRFVGDPVAAVAALDEETAEAALRLIDVEYEVLPAFMSIDEALAMGGPGACASTTTARTATCTRRSPSTSATSSRVSPRPTTSARTPSSSRATRTCRWSSTRPWRRSGPTASSRSGPRRRRRTTCTGRWRRCWSCRPRTSA